jgi:CubicO group peptidase (beta-lactamase class C family)
VANNWQRRDQSSTSAVLGDGGIYSSTEDLFKWDQALYGNKELAGFEDPGRSGAFDYTRLNNGKEIDYGFGWHLKKSGDAQVVYHTGSTTSFRNIIYRIPLQQFSIILLTNRNRPEETDMVGLAEKVAAAWKGR